MLNLAVKDLIALERDGLESDSSSHGSSRKSIQRVGEDSEGESKDAGRLAITSKS
jgi:hypothetical protein